MNLKLSAEKEKILKDSKHNIKVVAGPGSGKTTLIVEKIRQLVSQGVPPNRILAITYTNKAADDLEKKIYNEIPNKKGFYISTFHKFCTRFMSENPSYFTQTKGFRILDELGQYLFILRESAKLREGLNPPISIEDLYNCFGRIKDNYEMEELSHQSNPIIEPYKHYCELLQLHRCFDYGDLIQTVVTALNTNKDLRDKAQNVFDYMFIDEYQDVNKLQEQLIKIFKGKKTKLMVVGDRNQSIFGFRGSDVTIFDNFGKAFSNVKEYPLQKNFRSTTRIITVSNKFMQLEEKSQIIGNYDKKDGDITENGVKVQIRHYPSIDVEATALAQYLKELNDSKKLTNYSDVAVLFRSVKTEFSAQFMKELNNIGIKYEVIGDGGLLEKPYIKAIIECLQQINSGNSVKNDLIGVDAKNDDFKEAKNTGALVLFYKIVEISQFFQNALNTNREDVMFNLGKLSKVLLWYAETFPKDTTRIAEALQRLPEGFLDTEQPKEKDNNVVKILTLHKAKGLQFPMVIIPNISKRSYSIRTQDYIHNLFPDYDQKRDSINAFYVGITRAKQMLVLSYSLPNTPEEPHEYIKRIKGDNDLAEFMPYKEGLGNWINEEDRDTKLVCSKQKSEMLELTYYKLVEYWRCNYAYKLRFHYELQTPFTPQLFIGAQMHLALYDLNLIMMNHYVYEWEKIVTLLEKTLTPERYRLCLSHSKVLRQYITDFKNEIRNIEAPEKKFELVREDAIIRGKIDLLVRNYDKTYTIIEYKSGAYKRPNEDEKEQNDRLEGAKRQIELYACALPQFKVTHGIVYFLGDGGSRRHDFEINKKQMTLDIDLAISQIRKQNFPYNKESCATCVFAKNLVCPIVNPQTNKNPPKVIYCRNEDYEEQETT